LEKLFRHKSVSLGFAFLNPVGVFGRYEVVLPPLEIARGETDFVDGADAVTKNYFNKVLCNFGHPNWAAFEALAGVAPALRIAALTHDKKMQYETGGGRTVLQVVFGTCHCSTSATSLLGRVVMPDLQVRYVSGGNDVQKLLQRLGALDVHDHQINQVRVAAFNRLDESQLLLFH
jgi:hypothetical protein